jgi:hypothetical protein
MTESTDDASGISSEASAIIRAVEPPSALVIGGILGAAAFLLCALLLGVRFAMCSAALFALAALVRRVPVSAIGFALAAAITVAGSTTALLAASAVFGAALALFALARMRARVTDAMDGRTHRGPAVAA